QGFQVHPQATRPPHQRADGFLKDERCRALATLCSGREPTHCDRAFPTAGWPDQQSARTAVEPAPNQLVQCIAAAADDQVLLEVLHVLGATQSRENTQPTGFNDVIVIPLAE